MRHGTCMWSIALAVALVGCTMPGMDTGPRAPLHMQVLDYKVLDPQNVSISLAFHNTGSENLMKISVDVAPRIIHRDGSGINPGRIVAYPGSYFGDPRVFNDTDVLRPGQWKNVTLHGVFHEEVREDAMYTVTVFAASQDMTTRWAWTYTHPCLDSASMRTTQEGISCRARWFTREPTPAERLDTSRSIPATPR